MSADADVATYLSSSRPRPNFLTKRVARVAVMSMSVMAMAVTYGMSVCEENSVKLDCFNQPLSCSYRQRWRKSSVVRGSWRRSTTAGNSASTSIYSVGLACRTVHMVLCRHQRASPSMVSFSFPSFLKSAACSKHCILCWLRRSVVISAVVHSRVDTSAGRRYVPWVLLPMGQRLVVAEHLRYLTNKHL
jgi:hypothetical protein